MRGHVTVLLFFIMAARGLFPLAVFLLLCPAAGVWCFPGVREPVCGYKSCPATKPSMLNVHLVPHTHDDVGWLKTVDQYYYGGRNEIQHAGVQYILDSVVSELQKDPARRFIYVETAFFYRWWKHQDEETRNIVTQLVEQGRLEFVNGGWCMSDEASTHYSAVIDQMTLGLRFLNDTFGHCGRPRVAWHIDPFGHAREHASMFAQMGYDGLFFGRLDYQDKARRMKMKEMEMVWRASESLEPPTADLFTGILPNGYNPPEGFCWDQSCSDAPVQDDPDLQDYNVDQLVETFINISYTQAEKYKTNHIIMTMGSDFQYENAIPWYKNMDKLIHYVNTKQVGGSKVHVLYSTPSCYLQELNLANITWPLKTDDFFPYADNAHDFWTGYFTSRPALKHYERLSNSFLQTCNQLEVIGGPKSTHGPFGEGDSNTLKHAMAVAQHHDAVSGTEKQHVANDYAKMLAIGSAHCQVLVRNSLALLSGSNVPRVFCENLNISVCPVTERSKQFLLNVYNPLARPVRWSVHLPVNGSVYNVTDSDSTPVDNQVIPVSKATQDLRRDRGSAQFELVFQVQAPPMGFNTYTITLVQDSPAPPPPKPGAPTSIQNKYLKVTFDTQTGLLSGLTNLETQQTIKLMQNFYWYNASVGNSESAQTSGAYIFRPNSTTPIIINTKPEVTTLQNSVVQEVRQRFSPWVSQVVRLYAESKHLELEWTVGPIPVKDGLGKEVITRLDSSIETEGYFYTDSNGREILQRRKDYRPTWDLNQTEPIAGNYYPINTRAFIKDKQNQLTVVTDRSQGISSIYNGSLEIMVHRRLLRDDYRGVGEALSEPGDYYDGLSVRGRLLLALTPPSTAADTHRPLGQEMVFQPTLSFQQGATHSTTPKFSGLISALPPAVHVLTLSQWDQDSVLLRLEHQYERSESHVHSQPVTVSLQKMFSSLELMGVSEMSLGANQWKEDVNRMQWKFNRSETAAPLHERVGDPSPWEITLNPMEIRTFLLRVRNK
ncbi:lysosomal alpha-mannosidase [Tachysurus vachellii]|uniref:lysosomal alpha-mannosidase n=1 Tax=Tachysurus vachellii TaxID=175792 RepID=UPI00296AA286|nr:lysosomal alpha-mannosidase [Tachysurus vachellii]